MAAFDGLGEMYEKVMYLAIVGLVAILGGCVWGLWWLLQHVSLVVK